MSVESRTERLLRIERQRSEIIINQRHAAQFYIYGKGTGRAAIPSKIAEKLEGNMPTDVILIENRDDVMTLIDAGDFDDGPALIYLHLRKKKTDDK